MDTDLGEKRRKKEKKYICETCDYITCDNISRENDYWYGKWDDVFSNTLGLLIGHFIRTNNLHPFRK